MKRQLKKIYLQQKKRYLKKVTGTSDKPRLSVFRSHKHIYAQLIDDKSGKTLAFCSTLDKELSKELLNTATQQAAFKVGQKLGQKATGKAITTVSFDRGNKPYHGRIKQVAEGAREVGLIF
jgi:large subunit ribosomal protein L18